MTVKYDDAEKGKTDEPEIFATAVPAASNEPPIPAGHARFYCSKCHTVRISRSRIHRMIYAWV